MWLCITREDREVERVCNVSFGYSPCLVAPRVTVALLFCVMGWWTRARVLSSSHSLVSQEECSCWHFKAQSSFSLSGQRVLPWRLVPKCILSVMGFGHVSGNCYVIIRWVLLYRVGTRRWTLVVVRWVNGFALAFSSAPSVTLS